MTSKAALEGERKQVTVLFADLKGSMELLADRKCAAPLAVVGASCGFTNSEHLITARAMDREMDIWFWLEQARAELRDLGHA
jgi:hypothetical protein